MTPRAGTGALVAGLAVLVLLAVAVAAALWPVQVEAQEESGGSAATTPAAAAGAPSGETLYRHNCSSCHGLGGDGRLGPSLVGNANLGRADFVMALILRGGDGMPPFRTVLGEEEILAVTEYVRNAWGNDLGEVAPELLATQWWTGAEDAGELYARVCSRCHGSDGGGGFGPALAGNDNLADTRYTVGKILHGQGGMPAFEGILTTGSVEALASYVRTSFGNDLGPVAREEVLALHTRAASDGTASLLISSFPAASRLTVTGPDGFVRFVTGSLPLRLSDLPPGAYTVTASAEGYETAAAVADLSRGTDGEVSLVLRSSGGGSARLPAGVGPVQTALPEPAEQPVLAGATPLPTAQQLAYRSPPAPREVMLPEGHPALQHTSGPELEPGAEYQRSCALCHGPQGEGGIGPALAGNANLEDAQFLITTVLTGTGRMPAFAHRLDDARIAAAATFVRGAWGNGLGPVEANEVAALREDSGPGSHTLAASGAGAPLYEAHCSVCHGSQGAGFAGPGLRGNDRLGEDSYTVSRIVMGGGGMPAFEGVLSAAEVAEVATFIQEAWGNGYGPVSTQRAQNYYGGASSLDR